MNVMLSKTFFDNHYLAGEETDFKSKVLRGEKRHTCRANYDFWKKRVDTLKARQGVLSLRQWSGKPYQKGSNQEKIIDIAASVIDVQRLVLRRTQGEKDEVIRTRGTFTAEVDGTPVDIATIAHNDGLHVEEFKAWFDPVFDEAGTDALAFAVIHFTTFRY